MKAPFPEWVEVSDRDEKMCITRYVVSDWATWSPEVEYIGVAGTIDKNTVDVVEYTITLDVDS